MAVQSPASVNGKSAVYKANLGNAGVSPEFKAMFDKAANRVTESTNSAPQSQPPIEAPQAAPEVSAEIIPEKLAPPAQEPAKQSNPFEHMLAKEKPAESSEAAKTEISKGEPIIEGTFDENAAKDKFKTGESRQAFEKVIASRDTVKKELSVAQAENQDLKAKLVDAQKKAQTTLPPEDYEVTKKENAELKRIIESVKAEASPDFQKKYDMPLKGSMELMQKTLAGTTVDSNTFLAYLLSPESPERLEKIDSMLAELDPVKLARLGPELGRFEQLRNERGNELANAKGYSLKQQEQYQQQLLKQKESEAKVIEDVMTAAERTMPLLQKTDDPKWNETVDSIKSEVKKFWNGGATPQDLATTTLHGVAFPYMKQAAEHWYERANKAEAQLKSLKQAKPNVNTNTTTTPAISERPKTAMDAFRKGAGLPALQ